LSASETSPRNARTVAEHSLRDWEELRSRLAPVIGDNGFRVLFSRSLHKARYDFPWLARETKHSEYPFAGLKDSLQDQPSAQAEEANRELLAAFAALLNEFIGKALASRLLAPSPPPGTTS
jgi:hypothetical protein